MIAMCEFFGIFSSPIESVQAFYEHFGSNSANYMLNTFNAEFMKTFKKEIPLSKYMIIYAVYEQKGVVIVDSVLPLSGDRYVTGYLAVDKETEKFNTDYDEIKKMSADFKKWFIKNGYIKK